MASLLIVALLPTLTQAVGEWSDSSVLTATTLFGPGLAIDGAVINGEVALPTTGGVDDSQWTIGSTIVGKSVMTGHDSFFPSTLPSTLKVQHLVPDSTHPSLAFWYTPDVFERDSLGDGAKVEEWKSVANICHDKHSLRATLCAGAKQAGTQAIAGGNNMYVAALKQSTVAYQPIYKKKIANGHGVVRFQRSVSDGTAGSFMAMNQRCADSTCAAADTTEGWGADTDFATNIGANGMTVMMVVKMSQSATDRNNMGILHLNENGANKDGFSLYATESKCMPVLWGQFPLLLQAGGALQILGGTTLSIVKLAVSSSPAPSSIQNYYSGMTLKVFGSAVDANTGEQTRTHVCTIDKYLFGGRTTVAKITTDTVVTILGGSGSINGMSDGAINTLYLAVGCTTPNDCTSATSKQQIASIAANNGDTDITLAAALGFDIALGTQVYVCLESDGSNCIIASTSGACDVTTAPAAIGTFEIWKDATATGAPFCPAGQTRQFGTFNAYLNTDGNDDNSCASECATATQNGCNKETGDLGAGLTCADKQGTLGKVADANEGFKIVAVTINAARTGYRGYVNGFHEGCDLSTGFDGCTGGTITPPLLKAGASAAAAFAHMRLGVLADADAAAPATNFASMDMAELMVYDKQLTAEEMDRIGNYMANKYAIDDFIVNDDVRSPYRTKALSMSAGCGPTRRKTHSGIFGKGFASSTAAHVDVTGGTWKHNLVSLQDTIAINKADYYLGARLKITGGNGNTAGTVVSAKGQSCVITAYAATTKLATCDFTHQGGFGYVKYGTTATSKDYAAWINDLTIATPVTNGVAAADVTLYATWRPSDYTAPYIAVFGDPDSAAVEAVRVTSAVYQGTDSVLTVVRGVGGTTALDLTNANSKARAAAAKITYARAITMGDVSTTDTYIITSGVGLLYDLPTTTGITNWFAKLSLTGTTRTVEVVQVTQANAPTFKITADAANAATSIGLTANGQDYLFDILAGDVLSVQCVECGTGELVTVSGDQAEAGGGSPSTWAGVGISAIANANGFKANDVVTLVERKSVPNPSILVVVRARESTTAAAFALGAAQATLIDFMYMPQNVNSVGDSWVSGSGISTYQIYDCDVEAVPHVRDSPIQTFTGNGYLKGPSVGLSGATSDTLTTGASLWYSASLPDSSTSVAVGPAGGGQLVVIKGWNLMPLDTNIRYVTNDATDSFDLQRMENYLQVTIGQRPRECRDPTLLSAPCKAGTSAMGETALSCQIIEAGAGYCSNDFTKVCRCNNRACADCASNAVCNMHSSTLATDATTYEAVKNVWAQTRKPTIQCALPAVLGADSNDLNIYWHGVRTTLTNWYRPESPTIESIEPASAPYTGGSVITIHGRNFGPKIPYTTYTAGGAKTPSSKSSMVEIHGKSFAAACTTTTWVSDKQLLCTVPALPARKTAGIDTAQRTVEVQVVVSAQGTRNAQNAHSILTYSSVPTYYTCEYKSTSEAAKRDCFTCCRSACIVDEFALGGVKGGSTFSHCDSTCYSYCGYTTVA